MSEETPANARTSFSVDVITEILRLRNTVESRVALSRAWSDNTFHYALPYIGPLLTRKNEISLRAFADLAAAFPDLQNSKHPSLGAAFGQINRSNGVASDSTTKRVQSIYKQPLKIALPSLRSLLGLYSKISTEISWTSVWWTLYFWDFPEDRSKQNINRLNFLKDYYINNQPQNKE